MIVQKCAAVGFKQCSVCLQVTKSVCSKSMCKIDGRNLTMILPATMTAEEPRCLFPAKVSDLIVKKRNKFDGLQYKNAVELFNIVKNIKRNIIFNRYL